MIRFAGGERISHVLIWQLPPRNSCVLGRQTHLLRFPTHTDSTKACRGGRFRWGKRALLLHDYHTIRRYDAFPLAEQAVDEGHEELHNFGVQAKGEDFHSETNSRDPNRLTEARLPRRYRAGLIKGPLIGIGPDPTVSDATHAP